MLRRWRKAAFRRFVFPKRCSPRGTRAAGHIVPTHIMLRAALKHGCFLLSKHNLKVPTHIMPRAALKQPLRVLLDSSFEVPTHIMPRAALKLGPRRCHVRALLVPTHTMLRAALKHRKKGQRDQKESGPDTHNAACGIDNKTALRVHIGHTEPFSYAKSTQQS